MTLINEQDMKVVRLALHLAIEWEMSVLDSYSGCDRKDPTWCKHIKDCEATLRRLKATQKKLRAT